MLKQFCSKRGRVYQTVGGPPSKDSRLGSGLELGTIRLITFLSKTGFGVQTTLGEIFYLAIAIANISK